MERENENVQKVIDTTSKTWAYFLDLYLEINECDCWINGSETANITKPLLGIGGVTNNYVV